jgi:hypothetical protein
MSMIRTPQVVKFAVAIGFWLVCWAASGTITYPTGLNVFKTDASITIVGKDPDHLGESGAFEATEGSPGGANLQTIGFYVAIADGNLQKSPTNAESQVMPPPMDGWPGDMTQVYIRGTIAGSEESAGLTYTWTDD